MASVTDDGRVLVVLPTTKDSERACAFLAQVNIRGQVCSGLVEASYEMARGVGALIATEEAILADRGGYFQAALRAQPSWSAVPVVILTREESPDGRLDDLFSDAVADLTLVERPLRKRNLISAVRAALRSRRRQCEMRDIIASLEQAKIESDAASRAKDEFLAMLGHELRNPLAPILTALQIMNLRGDSAFAKERTVVDRQVRHLVRLVDDLLDVSRITRGKIALEKVPVDIGGVISEAIEMASPLIEQKRQQLHVELEPDLIVDGDKRRLAQVVSNLINNSAKYTHDGGDIFVRANRGDAAITMSVRDNGVGIRSEILPRVFDLFVQERQSLERSMGGLGLGLTIVRSMVSMHGGSVSAHSNGTGQGSEFVVSLPVSSALVTVDKDSVERAPVTPHDVGNRILIVDDNEDAAEALADLLRDLGHVVEVAYDGPAALQVLRTFLPQIAFLDIGLPVMNGYELASRIRQAPELSDIRLVAMTGYGQARDREDARAAGFDQHLVKPVSLPTLEQVILNEANAHAARN